MEYGKTIGNKIRRLRQLNNLTQKDLSKKLGIHRERLSYMENGEGIPKLIIILKLKEIFMCKYQDLLP